MKIYDLIFIHLINHNKKEIQLVNMCSLKPVDRYKLYSLWIKEVKQTHTSLSTPGCGFAPDLTFNRSLFSFLFGEYNIGWKCVYSTSRYIKNSLSDYILNVFWVKLNIKKYFYIVHQIYTLWSIHTSIQYDTRINLFIYSGNLESDI